MRVQVKSQSWGTLMDRETGKPRGGVSPQSFSGTVYVNSTGLTTIDPVDFVTDISGHLPGWVDQGTYTMVDPDGDSYTVEAVSGNYIIDLAVEGDLAAHAEDTTVVHGIADTARLALDDELFFNVRAVPAYGAVNDGTGNQSPAIQAAIDAAAVLGGTVYFPAGTYRCEASLVVPSNVQLLAASERGSILRKGDAGFDLIKIHGAASLDHCKYAGVQRLSLHGNGQTGRLIDCVYADNITLRDLYLQQNVGPGIDCVELWDSLIDNIVCEDVGSSTEPAIWIRSSRATAGNFGHSADNSNVIRVNNCRCESWKYGALRMERGTGATQNSNHIWVTDFKAESYSLRGPGIYVSDDTSIVDLKNIYVHMGGFDAGFSTPQNGITFLPGVGGSLRDVHVSNAGAATIDRGVYVWTGTRVSLDNIVGQYTTAPTTGNHLDLQGGGPYAIGNVHASGATRHVFLNTGVRTVDPGARFTYTTGRVPSSLIDGTDTTPVAGTIYYGHVRINGWDRLTGLAYLIGSTGSAGNVIVALYDADGTLVAQSNLAGTAVLGPGGWHRVAFTEVVTLRPGRYFAAVQFSGTGSRFRSQPSGGNHPTGSQAGTFGVLAAITPPTTFTADIGPLAMVY